MKSKPDNKRNETADTAEAVLCWTKEAHLTEGTRIDRYQILGLIGKGGMGSIATGKGFRRKVVYNTPDTRRRYENLRKKDL